MGSSTITFIAFLLLMTELRCTVMSFSTPHTRRATCTNNSRTCGHCYPQLITSTEYRVEYPFSMLPATRTTCSSVCLRNTANPVDDHDDDDNGRVFANQQHQQEDEEDAGIPTVTQIIRFCVPAMAIWLCSPLLSMMDTSTVGLFAGTAQQAALNPAVAVTDYSARTMSFLYTATTNLMAQQQPSSEGQAQSRTEFIGALQLSVWTGLALGGILTMFGRPMLCALIGNNASSGKTMMDPIIMQTALRYVRIRALGMPAAAVIGTAQAACLGLQDVKSPLRVVALASLVNLILDLALVGRPQAWLGGAAGTAWATIISQYTAALLFLRWLSNNRPSSGDDSRRGTLEPTSNNKSMSTRGFLRGYLRLDVFRRKPNRDTAGKFRPFVVPVTTTQVGRCSTYVAMGHVVSSSLGVVSMAANQIITSVFYTMIPVADSLSLTAQSFLPKVVRQPDSLARATAIKKTSQNLAKVAALMGLLLASVAASIPYISGVFSKDPAVLALVTSLVPTLLVIFALHGVFCGSEGILLAQRDLSFLGRMYAAFFVLVPAILLHLKKLAREGVAVKLSTVWNVFLAYQLVRISTWVGRVAWLQRQSSKRAQLDGACDDGSLVSS